MVRALSARVVQAHANERIWRPSSLPVCYLVLHKVYPHGQKHAFSAMRFDRIVVASPDVQDTAVRWYDRVANSLAMLMVRKQGMEERAHSFD
jgi:hypothetical protein